MIKHHSLALAVSLALAAPALAVVDQPRIFNKVGAAPELQAEHWYSIKAQDEGDEKLIEVFIYGEIGFWGVTSGDFIRDLKEQDDGVSKVLVHFDTIGGDLFDGIAIHNILRGLGERCTARIDGACFSAGSVAACGAHRVEMAENALMMIHNPWTFARGDSEELRKLADMMDKAREGILASYQHRPLTVDEQELSRMIDEETWMTPAEAQAFGFVDEILEGSQPLASNATLGKVLNRYRNVPEAARQLLAQAAQAPEPAGDPEPTPAPADDTQNDPAPVDDPQPTEPTTPEAAALAATLAEDCAKAGLLDCMPGIIKASGLRSPEVVKAELERAKGIRSACALAKRTDKASELFAAGLSVDEARLKLWDLVAAESGQVELVNLPPVDQLPQNSANQPPVPGEVYARRRQQASKGGNPA